ncbi:MAG: hypothetical protein OEW42_03240 [Acidimicrobiia bacterium]|nr:hypothetical protein [Acidimicrobiia bacterium]
MRIVNVANGTRLPDIWTDEFVDALRGLGTVELVEWGGPRGDDEVAATVRRADVAIVGWDARMLPSSLAEDPGSLRYVCCYSGTIRASVPRELVAAGIAVSNWGDHPAPGVAEGAMTLLLAMLHELPQVLRIQREAGFGIDISRQGTLRDLAVGIYGCGVIGHRFIDLLAPFGARVMAFDPYSTDLPPEAVRAESLAELCAWSEALVIHAGWSEETDRSLTAEHLARLPDHGIVINTARGGIVDQEALFAEVESGRLRAGLDVLEPDQLAADHAVRQCDELLYKSHLITNAEWPHRAGPTDMQRRMLAQLARFASRQPLEHLFDLDRCDRST